MLVTQTRFRILLAATSIILGLSGCTALKKPQHDSQLVPAPMTERGNVILSNLIQEYPIINDRWQDDVECIRIQSAGFGYSVGTRRYREDIIKIGKISAANESKRLKKLAFEYIMGNNQLDHNEASGFPALFLSGIYARNHFDYFMYSKCMEEFTANNNSNNAVTVNAFIAYFLSLQYAAEQNPQDAYLEKARFYAEKIQQSGFSVYSAFAYCSLAKVSQDPNDIRLAKEIVTDALPQFFDLTTEKLQIIQNADCLSWHEAMINSLADLAQMDPKGPWREYALKLLDYIFSDTYFNGKFIVHHINQDGTQANKVCPGCNYAALTLADRLYGDTFIIDPVKPPRKTKAELEILQAYYGVGDTYFDVTQQLQEKIQNHRLRIRASNDIAGDPLPEQRKILRVDYQLGDQELSKHTWEGQWLTIP